MAEASTSASTEPTKKKSRAGRNLPAAIAVGLVLVGIIIASLRWWHWGFAIFMAIALTIGVWELDRALRRIDINPAFWPIVVVTPLTVLLSFWVGQRQDGLGHAVPVVVGGLIIATLGSLFWRMRLGVEGYVKDAAGSLFIIGYLLLLGSTPTLLLADVKGAQRVAVWLLCVVAADTGAYAVGVLFGKHKMAPTMSPAKSWEGLAGGVATAMAAGAILSKPVLGAPIWFGLLLGFCLAIVGALGDLIESVIKRDVGIKDMSKLLPGHGGAMDRLDSLIVAAPVAWVLMYMLVPR